MVSAVKSTNKWVYERRKKEREWVRKREERWTWQINKNTEFNSSTFFLHCSDPFLFRCSSEMKKKGMSGKSFSSPPGVERSEGRWGGVECREMKIKELEGKQIKKLFFLSWEGGMKIELLSYRLLWCRFFVCGLMMMATNPFHVYRVIPHSYCFGISFYCIFFLFLSTSFRTERISFFISMQIWEKSLWWAKHKSRKERNFLSILSSSETFSTQLTYTILLIRISFYFLIITEDDRHVDGGTSTSKRPLRSIRIR